MELEGWGGVEVNATAAALLGLLRAEPRSGYALARLAAEELGDFWTVTRSQVYRELTAMADAGLVEAEEAGPRDRRPYRITEDGRAAFRSWLHGEPGPDTVRIPLLLRLAFLDELAPERLAALVLTQRSEHERRLAAYRDAETAALQVGADAAQLVTLRFGLRYEAAVLRWFDEDLAEVLRPGRGAGG